MFKTRPEVGRAGVARIPCAPVPEGPAAVFPGIQKMRDFLVNKYPAAASLKEADIADFSFIDELERSGFIERLYARGRG